MIKPEDLTDEMIRELRDSQSVTKEFRPIYNDCVRALGVEPTTGGYLGATEVAAARQRVCEHLNRAIGALVQMDAEQLDQVRRAVEAAIRESRAGRCQICFARTGDPCDAGMHG